MAQLSAVAAREEESSNAAIYCREAKEGLYNHVTLYIHINLISNMNTDTAAVKPCASKMNVFGHAKPACAKPAPAPASVSFSASCAEAPSSKMFNGEKPGPGQPRYYNCQTRNCPA